MSNRIELSPAELDRLEDALEDLELSPDLDPELDADDPVAVRLSEFRELLVLSREALPMEDVPAGLLDGVLAEARQASKAAPAAAAPWWSRLRMRVWLPTLAFAGSAALLLVTLLPRSEDEAAAPGEVAQTSPSAPAAKPSPGSAFDAPADEERRLADAVMRDDGSDVLLGGVDRGEGLIIGQREAPAAAEEIAPEPEPAAEESEAQQAADLDDRRSRGKSGGASTPKRAAKSSSSSNAPGSGSKGAGLFDDEPAKPVAKPSSAPKQDVPPQAPATKEKKNKDVDDLWSEVLEADRLRHSGSCGLANMRYEKARASEVPRVRARALAGRGLCEAAAGKASAAEKLFQQARAADPSVGAYIDAELGKLDQAPGEPANAAEQRSDVKE